MRNLYLFFKWLRHGTMMLIIILSLTLPVMACDGLEGEYLTFNHLEVSKQGTITALVYEGFNGNLERFEWYDTVEHYQRYLDTMVYFDRDTDMIAVYKDNGNFEWEILYSDWD